MSLSNNLLSDLAEHNGPHAGSTDWYVATSPAEKFEDFPSCHTQGSLFVSMQGAPNWN
jgi:hypothetical protein